MLSEEDLRIIIESLSLEEIIKPALNNWIPYESTGKTVIDITSGKIKGISIKSNEFNSMHNTNYVELYKIKFDEDIFHEEELLNNTEYKRFLEFKLKKENEDKYYDEYDPELLSEFCKIESIDENERKLEILIENYEEYHINNYQELENSIILTYYDEDDYVFNRNY